MSRMSHLLREMWIEISTTDLTNATVIESSPAGDVD